MKKISLDNLQLLILSYSIFGLQILLSPTISTAFAGQNLFILLSPPLIAVFLAAITISQLSDKIQKINSILKLGSIASLALFTTLVALKIILEKMNYDVSVASITVINNTLEDYLSKKYEFYKVVTALVISVPYYFNSLYLNFMLKKMGHSKAAQLISIELIGAAFGLITICLLLDFTSWSTAAFAIIFPPALISIKSLTKKKVAYKKLIYCLLLVFSYIFAKYVEPKTNLHISARDFLQKNGVKELRKSWNSYSKVQTLELWIGSKKSKVISLGDGTGHAQLNNYLIDPLPFTVEIAASLKPKKSLVLFAGAGSELFGLDKALKNPKELVGVELNKRLIEHALLEEEYQLSQLLNKKYIRLENIDARVFLESSNEDFDLILFSWSGATVSHYGGAIMHTTQYAFTTEAIKAAVQRLRPNGYMLILGASKLNILSSLKNIVGPQFQLSKSIMLLEPEYDKSWKRNWDNHLLIYKNGQLTQDEINAVKTAANKFLYKSVVEPNRYSQNYTAFYRLINSDSPEKELINIRNLTSLNFRAVPDDKPFVYNLNKEIKFHLIDTYLNLFTNYKNENILKNAFTFIGPLILLVIFFTTTVFLLQIKHIGVINSALSCLVSILIGASGMLLQIYTIYKFIFLIGNPTLSIVLALGIFLISSSLASLIIYKKCISGIKINFLIFSSMAFWLLFDHVLNIYQKNIFIFSNALKYAFLIFNLIPPALLSSLLFPKLMSNEVSHLKYLGNYWIGLDALAGALIVVAEIFLVESYGLTNTLYLALTFFCISFFMSIFIKLRV